MYVWQERMVCRLTHACMHSCDLFLLSDALFLHECFASGKTHSVFDCLVSSVAVCTVFVTLLNG